MDQSPTSRPPSKAKSTRVLRVGDFSFVWTNRKFYAENHVLGSWWGYAMLEGQILILRIFGFELLGRLPWRRRK